MPSMGWKQLFELGTDQEGLVSHRCARDVGLDGGVLATRARQEGWDQPFPSVYLLPGFAMDNRRRTLAAGLWTRGRGAIAGRSALAIHDLLQPAPATVELLIPRSQRPFSHRSVRTRWTRHLPDQSVTAISGVAVTDAARSLADAAASLSLDRLRAIGFDAVQRQLLTPARLSEELAARGRFAGRDRLRRLAADLRGDGSESGFEFETRRRLIQVGLPPDRDQEHVRTRWGMRRIDIAYRRERLGIECLGYAYHADALALQRDSIRANAIAALDEWLVLRLTWQMLYGQWESFLRDLRDGLNRRRSASRR